MRGSVQAGRRSRRKEVTARMVVAKYSLSFTTAGLLQQESLGVARLFLELEDWRNVQIQVSEKNLLQARTSNTAKRVCREIISRLKGLTRQQMDALCEGTHQEQGYLLWLAVCKRYRFIYDFAVEVLRERFLSMEMQLRYEDYDSYFNNKAQWHEEMEVVTETTRKKLRQVMFRMMREAELLDKNNMIHPVILTPSLLKCICDDSPGHLAMFPMADMALQEGLL